MFEEQYPAAGGTKEQRIRETFGFSAPRYYQQLYALAGRQEAEAEFPQLVHRLRRLMAERADERNRRIA